MKGVAPTSKSLKHEKTIVSKEEKKNSKVEKIKLSEILDDFDTFMEYKDRIIEMIKNGEIEVDEPLLLLPLYIYANL